MRRIDNSVTVTIHMLGDMMTDQEKIEKLEAEIKVLRLALNNVSQCPHCNNCKELAQIALNVLEIDETL